MKFSILLICIFLSACAFYPAVDNNHTPKCNLITKRLTLDVEGDPSLINSSKSPQDAMAIITATVAVGAVTAVISGSIVLVGNAIHWIEQEGTCDDGIIKRAIRELNESLQPSGAVLDEDQDEF
ncbi:MAG: hypothetical protein OEY00_07265 [Gammaproteobacteria bacterium]|nr:hypothetical protein [Gammaproteobacteria bacterium]